MLGAKLLLVASLSAEPALAIHQGALQIERDGVPIDLHVVSLAEGGGMIQTEGREMKLNWGGETRAFLAERQTDEMPVDNYFNFTLLNTELSYDIDLSEVGCSCNAALFFVSMPGHNPDGTIAHGDMNPYYCDANNIGGVWCWEHDTIEGNMYTMGVTPHRCNAVPGQYISQCHQKGCQSNVFLEDPKAFCPDASCKIDTSKPFRIIERYEADSTGTTLARIVTRLVQGQDTFEWETCAQPEYLQDLTEPFKGNWTMVFQLWGTDHATMEWLDEPTGCKGDCVQGETQTSFSNLAIRSLGAEDEVIIF